MLLIVLNPSFLTMSSSLLKDVPFSYTLLVGTIFLIEIVITKGDWISKTKNKVLFIIMCFFMVYTRHNGIANFLLMMILLIAFYKKHRKFYVSFFIVFIIARVIITGPIYNFLNVKPNIGTAEMLGVPLNQIRYIEERGKGFKKEYQDKTVLLSTHGCALKAILANIYHTPVAEFWGEGVHKNCAVTHLSVKGTEFQMIEEGKIYYTPRK